ncbi:FAD-binding oxidoreductase [Litoreibacter roseus]|uniref:Oxidoreductase n=1 Tax=Litoreibacter roseus TaxID=2601869 RepID=A0A6N6JFZ7_9RHOB|nr:FAD-binding oxidoreductase [Litoreibacter roseus]GFE64887.1 oxidoreductase [Litoreibacter roseus]
MGYIEEFVEVVGQENVRLGADMEQYATDWTGQYHGTPLVVLRPKTTQEASACVKICAREKIAIVPVAGNTGLNGGTKAENAVMISLERMNKIRDIRPDAGIAVVDAGVVLSSLHDAADEHRMVFPLTFGARGSAMIGGVLSTNAGGSNVVRYGSTRGLCLGLEVVLPDGRIMDLMTELRKDNSGYDLRNLMIGAEGTLGLITGAVLRLFPKPRAYATAMIAVRSLDDALRLLNQLQEETGGAVEAFEYMPRRYIEGHLELMDGARAPFDTLYDINILVEVGATATRESTMQADGTVPIVASLEAILGKMLEEETVLDAVIAQSEAQRREMWDRREAAAEIMMPGRWVVNHDIAVPLDKVAAFEEQIKPRLGEIDPEATSITVSHLGDGNVHYTVWPTGNSPDLADRIMEAVEDVALDLGGTFSAEHGIGLSKLNSMKRRKNDVALDIMRAVKQAIDPDNIMNPGKVLPAP